MSYYIDLDEPLPVLYYTTKGEAFRIPEYIRNMELVDHVPSCSIQLTDKNLLVQFMMMVHRSTEGVA